MPRKVIFDPKQIERIKAAFEAGLTNAQMEERFGISWEVLRNRGIKRPEKVSEEQCPTQS